MNYNKHVLWCIRDDANTWFSTDHDFAVWRFNTDEPRVRVLISRIHKFEKIADCEITSHYTDDEEYHYFVINSETILEIPLSESEAKELALYLGILRTVTTEYDDEEDET